MPKPTAVLVHGAFADATGWGGLIRELENSDYSVFAPPTPLRGLSSDAQALQAYVSDINGPIVLVGHSYGGAVITAAGPAIPNLAGLVYVAAFGIDEGESVLGVQENFAPPLLASSARPSPYPAPGTAGGPDLFIDRAQFRETFCADVPADLADVMAATQRPLSIAAATEPLNVVPGWKSLPSWYLVSAQDRAINPDLQRHFAERMAATTESIDGSHVAFIARPDVVGRFITSALTELS